ncbi:MAG: DNA-protecting protein DprA [Clostridiales bacterium]|nr:DNA-protecting protein DprA [Clostridiales bacterium]
MVQYGKDRGFLAYHEAGIFLPRHWAKLMARYPGGIPLDRKPPFDPAERGIRVLIRGEAGYPEGFDDLRHLDPREGPPVLLQMRGELFPGEKYVTLVGARRSDPSTLERARRWARRLAEEGVVVVSGLARGVDGACHRGALEGGGRTVALLGSGLGCIYPPEHEELAEAIAQRGALLSEFPYGMKPRPFHFPFRNRLLAAFSPLTVVVQAGAQSGALHTAEYAQSLGRGVAALPGPVEDPLYEGSNRLLQEGAHPVTSVEDILFLWRLYAGGRERD